MKRTRILTLVLCLLMVVSLFAACTEDKPKPNPNPNPNTNSNGEEANFEGEHFVMIGGVAIFPRNRRDYTDIEKEKEELEGSATQALPLTAEAMQNRILELEEKYKLEIEAGGTEAWRIDAANFTAQFIDGMIEADLFHAELHWARDLYNAGEGIVEPIDNLTEYINPDDADKWGSKTMLQATTYKGVLWGVPWHGSAYSHIPYICYGQMMCNPELLESFQPGTTVEEMVEARNWTFDGFSDLVTKVSGSTASGKIYGYLYQSDFPILAVYANGGDRVIWDEAKQKYVYGMTTKNAENALIWAQQFVEDTADHTGLATEVDIFIGGGTTFMTTNGNRIFSNIVSEMEKEKYQFVPFPYGPDAEYGTTHAVYMQHNDSAAGVFKNPTNSERTKFSAFLFNEITEPVTNAVMPDGYQRWLYRQNWAEGEEFSYNVYVENGKNKHWNYGEDLGSVKEMIDSAMTNVVMKGRSITTVQKLEANVNQQLDLTVNP